MKAPLPDNETARLEALCRYNILHTASEEAFDELTGLAAQICETPISLMTLVDNNRQWFKSKVGLTLSETPREISFCAHAILGNEVLVVRDALADERFATNPFVTGEPHIRFYAGAPLIASGGYALGTLCVIDYVPRELTSQQLGVLQTLSRQIVRLLELRRNLAELEQATLESKQLEKKEHHFFTLSLDLLCIADFDSYFKRLNPAWEKNLGYTNQELQSKPFLDFVHPEDQAATLAEVEKLTTGAPTIYFENRYRCKDGSYKWLAWTAFPKVEEGSIYAIARDMTANKQAEQERLQLLQREQAARNQIANILESITDAFFALDNEWRFTYLNQQAEPLLQRKREELLGKCLWDEFPEALDSPFYLEYKQAAREQVSVEFEAFYPPLNTWFSVHAYPREQGLSVYFQNINERKQAEEALRSSEERYRLLFERNPQPMCVYDLETLSFLAVNQATINHYGYSRDEFLGMTLLDIRPPEDVPPLLKYFANNFKPGLDKRGVWRHRKKDGSIMEVEITSHTLTFAGRQAQLVLANDVTERRRAEAELLETTTLQRAILDSANYTIISSTADGIIRTFNAAAQRLLGYTPEEVVGKETPLLFHDPEEAVQRTRELTEELGITVEPGFESFVAKARLGEPDERESTYIRKDGSRFPVLLSVTALRDSDGNITGFLGIGSDITERKQGEEALRQSEERFQLIVKATNDAVWDWDLTRDAVWWNEGVKTLFGYRGDEVGTHATWWYEHIHPEDRERVVANIHAAIASNKSSWLDEYRFRRADGSHAYVLDIGYIIHDSAGKPVRMIGGMTNITERKQAQEVIESRMQQQAVVIALGQRALAGTKLSALMDEATKLVAQSLDVEYCKVLELVGDGNALLLRAGVGWKPGLVGRATVGTEADSQAGYTLIASEPVIVEDLRTETRFSDPVLLHEHGVVSGLSVIIPGSNRPFGVLGAHTRRKRTFNQENVHFLQSVANVLATAMERQWAEEELRRQNRRSQLFAEITLKIRQSLQLEEILQTTVTEVQKILACDRVLLYRVWPNGTGCTVTEAVQPGWAAILGMTFSEEVFPVEYQELYCRGQVRAIADVKQAYADVTPCMVEFLKPWGVKAKLVVPILQNEKLWGLLIAHHCSSTRQWTSFETELLQQLSEQIGLALAQAQLLEIEKRHHLELARSNAELQEFAYVASHDLQEPLRKIQAFGDRLKIKYGEVLTDQGRDYLERMQNAAIRMEALIDDLLTLSRVTTRAQPFMPTNLTQVVQEVLSDLEVRIQQTGGRIEVGELPTLEADPIQMRQLLQNLIGNALKFHRAEEPPAIKIYSQRLTERERRPTDSEAGARTRATGMNSSERCQIFIEDNGIGFDEKYTSRIFNAFQRLHGRSEYEGTGMGLAICRKIVERHDGSITAQSVLGQGSTFVVTLPLQQRQDKK